MESSSSGDIKVLAISAEKGSEERPWKERDQSTPLEPVGEEAVVESGSSGRTSLKDCCVFGASSSVAGDEGVAYEEVE